MLKIYYELNESEPLSAAINAFKVYLRRNKMISADIKRLYRNFVDVTFQISKARHKPIEELETIIQSTGVLAERKWLIEKCGEIRDAGFKRLVV